MKSLKLSTLLVLSLIIGLSSCDKTEVTGINMTYEKLEPLGDDYEYEAWLIIDGAPVSVGLFDIDANGEPTANNFEFEELDLENTTAFVLTIEPTPDPDPAPSDVHILAGDLNGNSVSLSIDHAAAIGTDFLDASGTYILATPTDDDNNNENSGLWFIDLSGPTASLNIPTLPAGWKYEGWAVIDGTPVSTGTFTSASGVDEVSLHSGPNPGPMYPGEDFLLNAPDGLTFPTDLAGRTVVLTVEPDPDNSASPFALKPLLGNVASDAVDRVSYPLTNNAAETNVSGSVTLEQK